uniref:NADH:ubiquinone reductase (H(+)-translocating) n=1 Tax=Testudotaenia sp. WL-2016 TaxID=1873314 RepID=A0A1B1XZ19_9CEST|nr:NADH dehydrogenase subunit 5 [Testudotaenia sp. WL-2016]
MLTNFFCFSAIFFICLIYACFCGSSWLFSLASLSLNGMYWNSMWQLDLITIFVILMLCICFGYAYFYTGHYFSYDLSGKQLNIIICLFVAVMASLVFTGDFLTTLIFWEYLGVVSFFLILFYMNYLSLRASVVTLVSSRFGDVCLFLLIAASLYLDGNNIFFTVLLFFIIFTKSASFPFISWLLEAMRAPTPVSSLVHSSTLVAAGVWFSMRYDIFLFMSDSFFYTLILLVTIFVTGVCCFFFLDLKKIVALSTCNNIAWCIVYLIFGDVCLSLFQLLSHGVSKCLLFMLVGDVMSGSGGSQASNCVYSPQLYGNWGVFGLFSVILGLSGAPFVGVFFTKHFLLSTFSVSLNLFLFSFLSLCVFLSYFYSFRLCRVLYNLNTSLTCGVLFSFGSGLMVYFWLFVNFIIFSYLDEVSTVEISVSTSLIIFQFIACLTTYLFYNSTMLSSWSSSLFGCDNLVELMFNLFNWWCAVVSIFFYRWDSKFLSIFNGRGVIFLNVYKNNLLNLTFVSMLLFIVIWVLYII